MEFDFNIEKNKKLIAERGISFYNVIETIKDKGILLDIPHPNEKKYPFQRMLVVEINDYTYCVPYLINNNKYFLKTIFPSRAFLFLLKKED